HRPALQHAVQLQPQVVVQPPRRVLLDQIAVAAGGFLLASARLRRRLEIAFLPIGVEAHQLALRRSGAAFFFVALRAAFFFVLFFVAVFLADFLPPWPALWRSASIRSTT